MARPGRSRPSRWHCCASSAWIGTKAWTAMPWTRSPTSPCSAAGPRLARSAQPCVGRRTLVRRMSVRGRRGGEGEVPGACWAFAIASTMWFTVTVNPVKVGSIGEYIRQQREQAKISMRQLASAAGVSNPYLSQIERGLRRPSAEILQQIAKGLRISAEALYVQAGILEDRRPDSGVRAAVLADPEL